MSIETIAIGDELLDGRVLDRNSAVLGAALRERGQTLTRTTTIPDHESTIAAALDAAQGRGATTIVVSGGLGPTEDDRTRAAAASWLGCELVFDEASMRAIEQRFALIGMSITDNNRHQAWFPSGTTILPNDVGTAPAFRAVRGTTAVYFLPGVPSEYQFFLERDVLPSLSPPDRRLLTLRMKFFGVGESAVATIVDDTLNHPDVMFGYRAHFPEIHVSASVWSDRGDTALQQIRETLVKHLGRYLIAEGDETLSERIGRHLENRGQTVATAESCTGGLVSQRITAVPGASGWFRRGWVTYCNHAKHDLLGVRADTLADHGAVSRQTVLEMARGARRRAAADYAIALSGVAGPTGGTPDKPVGWVELAVDTPDGTWYRPLRMRPYWGRDRIRQASATAGLAVLLKLLEDRVGDDPKLTLVTDGELEKS